MSDPEIQKVDGRSREARAARAQKPEPVQRRSTGAATRLGIRTDAPPQPARPSIRGNNVVRGRDGEVLSRKRTGAGDPFDVKSDDPNYELQWIAMSVIGNSEVVMDQNLSMLENGWRPVPASRFPGRFMPAGTAPGAHITRGGQGLYERPKVLCEEARAEDVRLAKQLISDRNDALKLSGVKNSMPDGFAMSNRYKGTGGRVQMNIDPALDIPTPQHTLAEPGE